MVYIQTKQSKLFIKFDIVDFYLSITELIFDNAITFPQKFTSISANEISIIKHSCKSILYNNGTIWSKKNNDTLFDITMGSFHGTEIYELVGLYLLDNIKDIIDPKNIALYRDDGWAVVNNYSNADLEKVCKKLRRSIKNIGFNITIEPG